METQVLPRNRKLWGLFINPNGSLPDNPTHNDRHELFCVVLKNQERYALDLTHAQFGHENETLMPWRTYVDIRVHCSFGQNRLGYGRKELRKVLFETSGDAGLTVEGINDEIEQVTRKAICDIEKKGQQWVKVFKIADEATYQSKVLQSLQFVADRLDTFIATNISNGRLKMWSSERERRLLVAEGERMRRQKLEAWGEDNRGPQFEKALKAIRERQAREKKEWDEPNEIEFNRLALDGQGNIQTVGMQPSPEDLQSFTAVPPIP